MSYLQSYVVPICSYTIHEEEADLKKLFGTAFYFGNNGFFLTARHVVDEAQSFADEKGHLVGLVVKADQGRQEQSTIIPLKTYEHAPAPYDITAGKSGYFPPTPLKVANAQVSVWTDVAGLGYPDSAAVIDQQTLWMNVRGYKGHIQRPTVPRDIVIGTHPNGFELSFLTGPGSSGGPIFTLDETVIGVIVASFRSQQTEDQIVEIQKDGSTYKELRVRVEEFGFAHDIRGLLDWRAEIFEGLTLSEVSALPFGQLPSIQAASKRR
ncbi:serine protease [Rhodobacter sp. SY28-1]|uniref:S1 family peptidase n=1 Tax=Rhodobacter sp. SY28-1 TaxID=2562317 RepID=UPI0010C00660|nr:serine protease [Rhodobacter sp. SY28-1]